MRSAQRRRFRETRPALWLALATFLSLLLPQTVAGQSAPSRKASARTQYEKAEKQRTALEGKPQSERTEGEYLRLVATYRRVYLTTPHAPEVPAALLGVAELYQEMGRHFDPKYYQSAIDAYQFLLHEYPASRLRDDALFTIGQIQHEDMGQPEAAEQTFQEFLRRYPRSEKADKAREALAEMAEARKASARKKTELAEQRQRQQKLPQVTNIRHWNTENYTRIVISVEDAVQYQSARIARPDRIYFDIHKARLGSTLAGKTLDVQDGFLKTIRVAQNQVGVVRVVLEVDRVKDFSAFLLPDPHRMVVDIYGEPVASTKATGPADAPKSAKKGEEPPRWKRDKAEASRPETPRPETPQTVSGKKEPPAGITAPLPTREATAAPTTAVAQPTRAGQYSITRGLGLKIGRIVIDAGHGGHDTGTVGPTGLVEKELCLDLALRLGRMIQDRLPGTSVIFTREDDTFVPLEHRTALANQHKADLFLSIHANSSRDRQARGVETYYLNFATSDEAMEVAARENALSQASIHELQDLIKKIANNEKIEESRELALEIQEALSKRLKRVNKAAKNRGVKKAPFVVLIGANMPSVLSEVSFLSNPSDEALLKRGEHRQRVVEGLFRGVQNYLESLGSISYNQEKPAAGTSR